MDIMAGITVAARGWATASVTVSDNLSAFGLKVLHFSIPKWDNTKSIVPFDASIMAGDIVGAWGYYFCMMVVR